MIEKLTRTVSGHPAGTDTSMYVDTNLDKIDGIISGENENHLFSLSSTQPENQFKMFSPAAPIMK